MFKPIVVLLLVFWLGHDPTGGVFVLFSQLGVTLRASTWDAQAGEQVGGGQSTLKLRIDVVFIDNPDSVLLQDLDLEATGLEAVCDATGGVVSNIG